MKVSEKSCRPHQRDTPPLLIPVAANGKCKQISIIPLWLLIIHKQNQPDLSFKASYLIIKGAFQYETDEYSMSH